MSATEAARQRLDTLRKQQSTYREKLLQQEAELRRLQNEVYQNRTVVEVTMPGEISKAYGEYLDVLKKSPLTSSASKTTAIHQKASAALLEEDLQTSHSYFFSTCSSSSSSSSPFLGLLTLTTTILLALWDTVLCALMDRLFSQVLAVLGLFFPAMAYASQRRRSGSASDGGDVGREGAAARGPLSEAGECVSGGRYGYGRGRTRGSTRFAPIHM